MASYSIETRGELEPVFSQEWLLTNGLGSSAFSTVVGCNTRRYHGLLCAATKPPVARYLLLSRIGEVIQFDGKAEPTYELSVNQFEHHMHPCGFQHLVRFELGDTARWVYEVENATIEKEVLLCYRRNVVGIKYTVRPAGRKVSLELLPFVAMRDFHGLRHGTDNTMRMQSWGNHVTITDQKLSLHMTSDKGAWREQPYWWHEHVYPVERARGMDYREELWNPGRFVLETEVDAEVIVWASAEPIDQPSWEKQLEIRREATGALLKTLPAGADDAVRQLWTSADAYITDKQLPQNRTGKTILAGYPWFADWGRDTMIALPGLLLATGRHAEAMEVLRAFAENVSEGMIPNVFDDYSGEPHYNTVDASLWFIHAAHEYLASSGDRTGFEQVLLPACRHIVEGYKKGTRFNIHMDQADGLITQGDASTQLTWMDGKRDGVTFTPRQGKPVEINALWYNALVLLGEKDLAAKVRESFVKAFWISPFRGLADVVNNGERDTSIRPNQIFAVSLPNSPLTPDQGRAVVEVVRRELLTPYGLRTLAAGDPKYCPRFEGGPFDRDRAYHNGTVWPWLIGPFIEAYLRSHDNTPEAKAKAREWLKPLLEHLNRDCLGHLAEVFDADAPHRPGGCPAQAWSDAEVLRVLLMLR